MALERSVHLRSEPGINGRGAIGGGSSLSCPALAGSADETDRRQRRGAGARFGSANPGGHRGGERECREHPRDRAARVVALPAPISIWLCRAGHLELVALAD